MTSNCLCASQLPLTGSRSLLRAPQVEEIDYNDSYHGNSDGWGGIVAQWLASQVNDLSKCESAIVKSRRSRKDRCESRSDSHSVQKKPQTRFEEYDASPILVDSIFGVSNLRKAHVQDRNRTKALKSEKPAVEKSTTPKLVYSVTRNIVPDQFRCGEAMRERKRGASVDYDPAIKYQRQQRNPTREDRYEYKGDNASRLVSSGIRPTRRKRKFNDDTSPEHFQAANVDSGCITLKPRNTKGLFSKSKSSLPIGGRDLPDLTFSEMSFLSRPHNIAREDTRRISLCQKEHADIRSQRSDKMRAQFGSLDNVSSTEVSSVENYHRVNPLRSEHVRRHPESENEGLYKIFTSSSPLPHYKESARKANHHDSRIEHYLPMEQNENTSLEISWPSSNLGAISVISQSPLDHFEDDWTGQASRESLRHGRMDSAGESCSINPMSSISNCHVQKFTDRLLRSNFRTNSSEQTHEINQTTYHTLDELKAMHRLQTSTDTDSSPFPKTDVTMTMRMLDSHNAGTSMEKKFATGCPNDLSELHRLEPGFANHRPTDLSWKPIFNYQRSETMEPSRISATPCEARNSQDSISILRSLENTDMHDGATVHQPLSLYGMQSTAWRTHAQRGLSVEAAQDKECLVSEDFCRRAQDMTPPDEFDAFDLQLFESVQANTIGYKSTHSTPQVSPSRDAGCLSTNS